MKPIPWLLLIVLCSVTLVQAQSSSKQMELSGTICQSSCVSPVNGVATCDRTCTDKRGDAVFVDDQGNVMKISQKDQIMCKSHMGKHVKMTAKPMGIPTEAEREKTIDIMHMYDDMGGG